MTGQNSDGPSSVLSIASIGLPLTQTPIQSHPPTAGQGSSEAVKGHRQDHSRQRREQQQPRTRSLVSVRDRGREMEAAAAAAAAAEPTSNPASAAAGRGRRRRLTTAVGWVCAAAAVAVLARAPVAAAQEAATPVASRGYVRRRGQELLQEQEQERQYGDMGRIGRGLQGESVELGFEFLQQIGLSKAPGPLSLTPDRKVRTYVCGYMQGGRSYTCTYERTSYWHTRGRSYICTHPIQPTPPQNLYTVTGESLVAFKVDATGSGRLEQIQELRDGVVDKYVVSIDRLVLSTLLLFWVLAVGLIH